jgi:hypothetical protein
MKTAEATILILLLLLVPVTTSVSALTNVSFGGKSGDWIEYQFQNVIGLSSDETERVDFLNVSGTTVTFRMAVYTPTFTEQNETESIDLTSQEDLSTLFLSARVYFIPGGLGAGDPVHLGVLFGTRTITGETTRSYLGVDRRVVYANFSDAEGNNYMLYWDKQTGVLVEGSKTLGAASSGVVVEATSMWSSPFPLLVWISIAAAIVLGVLSSRKNVRKKLRGKRDVQSTSKTATPSQSASSEEKG